MPPPPHASKKSKTVSSTRLPLIVPQPMEKKAVSEMGSGEGGGYASACTGEGPSPECGLQKQQQFVFSRDCVSVEGVVDSENRGDELI